MTLIVGQTLWYAQTGYRYNKRAVTVTITKIGRKWAELGPSYPRINIKSLRADCGDRCWLSETDYNEEIKVNKLWANLKARISYQPPDGMTADAIRQAAVLLNIALP